MRNETAEQDLRTQRTQQIGIRLTDEERALLEKAAATQDRTISDWGRATLLRAARAAMEPAPVKGRR